MRVDNNAEIVRLPWSVWNVLTGRYAVRSGRRIYAERFKPNAIAAIRTAARDEPVAMCRSGRRTMWLFHERFYRDDEGLAAEDVKALALQRERRARAKVQSARSLMRAEENGLPTREPIPRELGRAVYERDGGRCVQCGSSFPLQYDHILPVALGGATTLENLQLLCADCNREKSDSL